MEPVVSADEPEDKTFPLSYVKELRAENAKYRVQLRDRGEFPKGYLPGGISAEETNAKVYINKYPLGDVENFSVSRACYAITQQKKGRGDAWRIYAPWEKAYIEALAETQFISPEFKAQGEMVTGIDGGYLAPEDWGTTLFDLLRSLTITDYLPTTKIQVPARVEHLPKISGDITVYYPGENAGTTASQFNFGQLTYTARKAVALINVSSEMMRDAPLMTDQVLRVSAARTFAVDRDTQALLGQGGSNPTGLITMATAGTISKWYPGASASAAIQSTAAHATPSFNHVSQLRGKVTSLSGSTLVTAGQAKCTGIVAHSRFEQTVATLGTAAGPWTDAQGRPLWLSSLGGQNARSTEQLLGNPWALTNILPTNSTDGGGTTSSFMIAGWWLNFIVFECLAIGFDATEEGQGMANYQTQVKLISRGDSGPAHPEAFSVLAGCDQ